MGSSRWFEFVGWLGVIAILGAYALSNFGVIELKSATYLILNLAGSIAIVISSLREKDPQPAALNAVWALIALLGIIRLF